MHSITSSAEAILPAHKVGRQRRKPIVLVVRIFDDHIMMLNEAGFGEAGSKRGGAPAMSSRRRMQTPWNFFSRI
jgi:hypothetical protein